MGKTEKAHLTLIRTKGRSGLKKNLKTVWPYGPELRHSLAIIAIVATMRKSVGIFAEYRLKKRATIPFSP